MSVHVFLGPSLSWREARALLPGAKLHAPAGQGDVFAVLPLAPAAIVLIDGVFEARPSVWHHELLAAQASGARVFGASSMGALRAAELPGVVEPVGEIAKRFASGAWNDDAHVALLHGDATSGFRPLTLPWVNAWATFEAAVRARVLTAARAREAARLAEEIFYRDRTWRAVLAALGHWPAAVRSALEVFVRERRVDLKADDARACLRLVAGLRARGQLEHRPAQGLALSSFVRRRRLAAPGASNPAAGDFRRRLLVADLARVAGIEAEPDAIARWRGRLAKLAPDVRERWAEALALDELVVGAADRFVSDGPSTLEASVLASLPVAASRRRRGGQARG